MAPTLHPGAYITHNATRPPTVRLEIWVCVMLVAANVALTDTDSSNIT